MLMEQERCLTEYILPEFKEKYSDFSIELIQELVKIPCVFAYENFKGNDIDKPKVFVSYSWNPPSNQQNVFELIKKLELDGINVVYDRKVLYPGQDINYFMESILTSEEIDAVIIACNKDYAEKANKRMGGVGYESELILSEIKNDPLQRKYIPVIFEYNENGELPLPNFLKSRFYVDLSKDTGYEDLLIAIRKLK